MAVSAEEAAETSSNTPTVVGDSSVLDSTINLSQPIQNARTSVENQYQQKKEVRPYSAFSLKQKYLIVFLGSFAGIWSPISSNIFVPALPQVAAAFNVTIEKANLAVTIFLIFQGISPTFWGSLSDTMGRRPTYIATLLVYVLSCLAIALIPTDYPALMVLRCIQAFGGSSVIAIGAGVIGDVAAPHERGSFMGYFQGGQMLGPAVGPVLGGVMAQHFGWRGIFWFLMIGGSVCIIPLSLFLPETLRSIVGNGSALPPPLNTPLFELYKIHQRKKRARDLEKEETDAEMENRIAEEKAAEKEMGILSATERWERFKPLVSLTMLFEPDIFMVMFFASLMYTEFYCVLTATSTIFKSTYGLDETTIGLTYLANGGGAIVAAQVIGRILDSDFRRIRKNTFGDDTERKFAAGEFPTEYARFYRLPVVVLISHAATIGFGWSCQVKANLAVPVVMQFFIGFASAASMSIVQTYAIDIMPGRGSAITASFNLIRCLMGAVGTSVIDLLIQRINVGWSFVLISGICLVFAPLPVIVWRKGPRWRKQREEKMQQEKMKHEVKRKGSTDKA